MAQVAFTAGTPGGGASSLTHTVGVPISGSGGTQVVVVTHTSTQVPTLSPGTWTLHASSDPDSGHGTLRRFIRVGAFAAATITLTFGTAAQAKVYAYSVDGEPYDFTRNTASQSTNTFSPIAVPSVNSTTDGLVVSENCTGIYSRIATPTGGITERYDDWDYNDNAGGGTSGDLTLFVGSKAQSTNASPGGWTLTDESGGTTNTNSFYRMFAISFIPAPGAGSEDFSVAGSAQAVYVPAPSVPVASAITSTGGTISWTSSGTITGFDVAITPTAGGSVTTVQVGASSTSYTFSGLTGAVSYTASVRAFNSSDYSAWQGVVFTTLAGATVINSPSNILVNTVGETSAAISWQSNSSNHTAFEVWAGPVGSETLVATTGSTVTTYTMTALSASTTYQVRVRAVAGSIVSGFTNLATFTTAPSSTGGGGGSTGGGTTTTDTGCCAGCTCRVCVNLRLRRFC